MAGTIKSKERLLGHSSRRGFAASKHGGSITASQFRSHQNEWHVTGLPRTGEGSIARKTLIKQTTLVICQIHLESTLDLHVDIEQTN